jgi:hypothetical protein
MTWKIEKRSYSSNPWRLIDETGREVYSDVTFDHPDLGKSRVSMPVCGPTKQSIVDQVLGGFVAMRSILRKRTVALRVIHTWTLCDHITMEDIQNQCIDALSYAADETNQKEAE